MQPILEKWLRYWWPNVRVDYKVRHAQASPSDEKRAAEAERDHRINSVNEVERGYLSQLIRRESNPHRLMKLALQCCAGMPLADLAFGLACASFSMALTPSPFSPDEDLSDLIRFNRSDWSATRIRLMSHAERLASPGSSVSGRWAAVTLLRATGALSDSAESHRMVLDLTKDRGPIASWRRVETYCATDPCDPDSVRPDNIDNTSREYAELDVNQLRLLTGMTERDHYWESALPGLARFSPEVAVRKHRELLDALPSRQGLPLRQATWAALDDAALVDDRLAARLLALSISLTRDRAGVDEASVEHVQQALLLAAFPCLSADEQFAGVDAIAHPDHIWLELLRRADGGLPSQLMDAARLRNPSDLRSVVPLVLVRRIDDVALPRFVEMLPALLSSPHSLVRSIAFHLARISDDPEALRVVVASGWMASTVSRTAREHMTGSLALIEAAVKGVVTAREILPRIAPETFAVACARLDKASIEHLAAMLDACVRAASGFDVPLPPVEIVLAITRTADSTDARHSLEEGETARRSLADALSSFSEGESDFNARQKKLHDAYEAFRSRLTPEMAPVVLDAFHLEEIQTISSVAPGLVHGWIELLQGAPAPRRRALRNFGLYLACALTHGPTPSKGIELLALLQEDTSYVHVRYTLANLPLEAVALWWSADGQEVNRLRYARLDACGDHQGLALEAATAVYAGKQVILKAYVQEKLGSAHPVDVARAIAVAGFGDDALFATEVSANFRGDEGLLPTAARSSLYAMDRYRWSKHWFNKMLAAITEEDFWTASVLFLVSVRPGPSGNGRTV